MKVPGGHAHALGQAVIPASGLEDSLEVKPSVLH